MNLLFFSMVTSLIWFNIFVIIIVLLRKSTMFITSFNVTSILFIALVSILRAFIFPNVENAIIIRSENIFSIIYAFIKKEYCLYSFCFNIYDVIVFIWIIGILIGIFNIIKSYHNLQSLKIHQTISNDEKKFILLKKILVELNLEDSVTVIIANDIVFPMVIGVMSATIYLPNLNFSEQELRYLILHEINHFRGKDQVKKSILQLFKTILWWNPFVYILAKEIENILEVQCDLRTTKNMSIREKKIYLNNILTILRYSKNFQKKEEVKWVSNLINNNGIKEIKNRFKIVLNYNQKKYHLFVNTIICICVLLITVTSYFFVFQPAYYPTYEDIYISKKIILLEEL